MNDLRHRQIGDMLEIAGRLLMIGALCAGAYFLTQYAYFLQTLDHPHLAWAASMAVIFLIGWIVDRRAKARAAAERRRAAPPPIEGTILPPLQKTRPERLERHEGEH